MGAICPMVACALKKGIEFCGDCGERESCARWRYKMNFGKEHDSHVSYRKLECNISFIKEHGIEAFDREQECRERLPGRMIAGFNDGRSKGFFCVAATVMEPEELEQALMSAEASSADMSIKDKAKEMRRVLEGIAAEKDYNLALRK